VSDAVTLARTARESLARGLNALQADPSVPPQLIELGAPIAAAMGALHRIEASRGAEVAPNAQTALNNVQQALAGLQAQPPTIQAVVAAMEAVAGALGAVHALARVTGSQPAISAPVAPQAAPPPAAPAPQAYAPQPAPMPAVQADPFAPPRAPVPAPMPMPMPQGAYGAPPAGPMGGYPAQGGSYGGQPAGYPQQPGGYGAPQQGYPAQPGPAYAQGGAPGGGGYEVVAAELGAHSPSNFYKGLSGNDIVDHGGLFISTYKLPKIGSQVRVRVSLPGGYEFEANAMVRWRREPSDAGSDAPPGFGAQFTEITPEARQLVYRYVRNREPMFHDDL
jgi:hypothetical protein